MRKAAFSLVKNDCIGASAAELGKPGKGYFRVPVISVEYLGGPRVAVHTPGGVIECLGLRMFDLVEPLEMHTDSLAPQFPVKSRHKGRTVD